VTDAGPHARPAILVVHARYRQRAGEDAAVEAEIELLRTHGHRVEVLLADNDSIDDRTTAGRLRAAAEALWSRRAARRVRRLVSEVEPAIVHVHNTFPVLSPSIYRALVGWPGGLVQSVHNYRFACPSANFFRDGHPCHDCMGRPLAWPGILHGCYRGSRAASAVAAGTIATRRLTRAWARVDRFMAPSSAVARLLAAAGIPEDRVRVKPNFVAWDPGPGRPGDAFLFAGRLTVEKGIDTLLVAWSMLADPPPLRIAGAGPLEALVREVASRHPSVTYLGELAPDAVRDEMARAAALVFPSRWPEPFGLSVIEAFASGIPVLAARAGAPAELVEDGRTGRLFEPSDPAALAAVVDAARRRPDELAEMGAAGRRRYLELYTAAANHAALAAIYDDVLAERARIARPAPGVARR
jgi:glycosyltransferase involved in cell wall biosynthesis